MIKGRIVVVEDEPAIRRGVLDTLRISGYDTVEAADGLSGFRAATQSHVDLVLLDILLPQKDGLEVLCEIRKLFPTRPVILLTARGTEDDRVRGLKLGADDYVVKPFSARELIARVEAVLRRCSPQPSQVSTVALGKGMIDLPRREIRWPDGERLEMSETETALLQYLVTHRMRAVTREELLERVWGITPDGLETRTVDMHVARLRAKLKDPTGSETAEAIVTVRSRGYMAGPALNVKAEAAC
jgi:DNA-binding response OmpR family regulator